MSNGTMRERKRYTSKALQQGGGMRVVSEKEQGMDYTELVEDLRYCVSAEAVCDECKHADELCCEVELMRKAADAIKDLLEKYQRLFESTHN